MSQEIDQEQPKPRFGWDFQCLEAFALLTERYLKDPRFQIALDSLFTSAPDALKQLHINPVWGVVDPEHQIQLADVFLPLPGATHGLPGDYGQLALRYQATWESCQPLLPPGSDWAAQVERTRIEWGLRCDWGTGALIEMMFDQHWRQRRANDNDLDGGAPFGWFTQQVRLLPGIDLDGWMTGPPWPSPGISDKQWSADVERFKQEGLSILRFWRQHQREIRLWRATYTELRQHVDWLFVRITPPHPTPTQIVNQTPGWSTDAVSSGIGKAARLLRITLPKGVRGKRSTLGLARG